MQVNTIRHKRGEITTDAKEIQRIIIDYYEQLYCNKLYNSKEMDKFVEPYNLLSLKNEEIENLNRLNNSNEIESVIKNTPPQKKSKMR